MYKKYQNRFHQWGFLNSQELWELRRNYIHYELVGFQTILIPLSKSPGQLTVMNYIPDFSNVVSLFINTNVADTFFLTISLSILYLTYCNKYNFTCFSMCGHLFSFIFLMSLFMAGSVICQLTLNIQHFWLTPSKIMRLIRQASHVTVDKY